VAPPGTREPCNNIIRAVEEAQPRGGYGHLRRGALLREDVMDLDLPTRIAGAYGAGAAAVEVGLSPGAKMTTSTSMPGRSFVEE
jgi:hypothetical protein